MCVFECHALDTYVYAHVLNDNKSDHCLPTLSGGQADSALHLTDIRGLPLTYNVDVDILPIGSNERMHEYLCIGPKPKLSCTNMQLPISTPTRQCCSLLSQQCVKLNPWIDVLLIGLRLDHGTTYYLHSVYLDRHCMTYGEFNYKYKIISPCRTVVVTASLTLPPVAIGVVSQLTYKLRHAQCCIKLAESPWLSLLAKYSVCLRTKLLSSWMLPTVRQQFLVQYECSLCKFVGCHIAEYWGEYHSNTNFIHHCHHMRWCSIDGKSSSEHSCQRLLKQETCAWPVPVFTTILARNRTQNQLCLACLYQTRMHEDDKSSFTDPEHRRRQCRNCFLSPGALCNGTNIIVVIAVPSGLHLGRIHGSL